MDETNSSFGKENRLSPFLAAGLVAVIYFITGHKDQYIYDYTFRIAEAMWLGHLGLTEQPPSWIPEFVPLEGRFYSVFPLGAVLSMLPVAGLKRLGLISGVPGATIASLIAGLSTWFFYHLSGLYGDGRTRRWILTLFPALGSWMWMNLAMSESWQVALGFAILGQSGALYFTLVKARPFWAGCFFALAFGNRTEVLLAAPLFMYLLWRGPKLNQDGQKYYYRWQDMVRQRLRAQSFFLLAPFVLGVLTLIYNYVRFHSVTQFGNVLLPGIKGEACYRFGIFSLWYIPANLEHMLINANWQNIEKYPFFLPKGLGGSIFAACPFLFLLFRSGARDRKLKILSWMAVTIITFLLWAHGNTGGWQFGYRYAMSLLPWLFLILVENSPQRVSLTEKFLFGLSVVINLHASYLFLWTSKIQVYY